MNADRVGASLITAIVALVLLLAIIFAPSRACPDDFPGKGDIFYFWPGRIILPPESTVTEWRADRAEPNDDPEPKCIPDNEECEFPTEDPHGR